MVCTHCSMSVSLSTLICSYDKNSTQIPQDLSLISFVNIKTSSMDIVNTLCETTRTVLTPYIFFEQFSLHIL